MLSAGKRAPSRLAIYAPGAEAARDARHAHRPTVMSSRAHALAVIPKGVYKRREADRGTHINVDTLGGRRPPIAV